MVCLHLLKATLGIFLGVFYIFPYIISVCFLLSFLDLHPKCLKMLTPLRVPPEFLRRFILYYVPHTQTLRIWPQMQPFSLQYLLQTPAL